MGYHFCFSLANFLADVPSTLYIDRVCPLGRLGHMRLNKAQRLAIKIGQVLTRRGLMLVTAESCTGGAVVDVITAVPESAAWFDRGFVTYSDHSKQDTLGVKATTLQRYGGVSQEVAREMVLGALAHSAAQVGIGVAGIAGHIEGPSSLPIGTACIAWIIKGAEPHAQVARYVGDREMIRHQVVVAALHGLLEVLATAERAETTSFACRKDKDNLGL